MAERDDHRINGQVLHESLPQGASACSLRLAGRTLVARLPSGDGMKMDLRDAEPRRGGPAGRGRFVYDSRLSSGPTFVIDDADLGRAAQLAWSRARVTQARPARSGGGRLPRSQKVALGILGVAVALILLAVLMVGPLVRVTLRFVPRVVDGRVGEEYKQTCSRTKGLASAAPRAAATERATSCWRSWPSGFRPADRAARAARRARRPRLPRRARRPRTTRGWRFP